MPKEKLLANYIADLRPGETHLFGDRLNAPTAEIVGTGKRAYLWVGDKGCVGTLHGSALRKLAVEILARLGK